MKGDREEYGHHDESEYPPGRERHARDVLCDQHAERVDAGAPPADTVGNPDHPHRHDGVHSHGERHRHDDRDQRYVFLAHADREGAQAEHRKAAHDQDPGAVAEFLHGTVQRRVDCTGPAQYFDDSADDENQGDDVLGIGKAFRDTDQEIPGRQRHRFPGCDGLVGAGNDHRAVGVVGERGPLERALRDDVGHQLGYDDEREDQCQRIDVDAALLHGLRLVLVVASGGDYNKKGPESGPFRSDLPVSAG